MNLELDYKIIIILYFIISIIIYYYRYSINILYYLYIIDNIFIEKLEILEYLILYLYVIL